MKLEDMNIIIQEIENRLQKIGWKFAIKPYMIDNNCNKYQLEIIQNDARDDEKKKSFIITKNSFDLSISFQKEEDSIGIHKKFRNLDNLLDFIKECLLKRKIV